MTTDSIVSATYHTVTVISYNSGGEGVARLGDGRVVFIRGSARGDVLEVRLISEQSRSARAEIVRILAPSQYRVEPDCLHYPECGGCDFRHITYEEELESKLQRINDAMERIGKLSFRVTEILRTGQTERYRNKILLHSDGTSLGLYRSNSRQVIPINHCLLVKEDLNDALATLVPGRDVTLRSGRNGLSRQPEEELDGLVFQISGFFQINTGAALLLYKKAREYAALSKNEALIDLYCGVGSLTLFVGRDARYALGVELNSAAVEKARENALLNGLSHIEFINADAAGWNADIPDPGCVIVDPPRRGLSPGAVQKVIDLAPKRIVYISCDPATLARDLRLLEGYSVKNACAVDMFPRTANIECCCLLIRS